MTKTSINKESHISIGPRASWIDEVVRQEGHNPDDVCFVIGNKKSYWIGFRDGKGILQSYSDLFPEITTA